MKLDDFYKLNEWKNKLLGSSLGEVVELLGLPTDEGAGDTKETLKKFGDIEVGFDEQGNATYCLIDLGLNLKLSDKKYAWTIVGGTRLDELSQQLDSIDGGYEIKKDGADYQNLITRSGIKFSFLESSDRYSGGLVTVSASKKHRNLFVNEEDILEFLIKIKEGKIKLSAKDDPQVKIKGDIIYEASDGWKIEVSNWSGTFSGITEIIHPERKWG